MLDCTLQTSFANNVAESTYALPEKTKRGPPTNKNIPVRNMKAQVANMSLNENGGFKSEYHVRFFKNDFFFTVEHSSNLIKVWIYFKVVKNV